MPPEQKQTEIRWRAAEYEFVPKSIGWHAGIGIATLVLVGIALWQQNLFFAIFILIGSIMVIVLGNRHPEIVDFLLNKDGCHIGETAFYPFEKLESFSIRERPHRSDELILKRKTAVNQFIHIPIEPEMIPKIRTFLEDYLPEEEHEPSVLESITDILGF